MSHIGAIGSIARRPLSFTTSFSITVFSIILASLFIFIGLASRLNHPLPSRELLHYYSLRFMPEGSICNPNYAYYDFGGRSDNCVLRPQSPLIAMVSLTVFQGEIINTVLILEKDVTLGEVLLIWGAPDYLVKGSRNVFRACWDEEGIVVIGKDLTFHTARSIISSITINQFVYCPK